MKKLLLCVLASCSILVSVYGQISPEKIQALKEQLQKARHDSTRLELAYQLAVGYRFSDIDSSLLYSDIAIELADKLNLFDFKAQMLSLKGATVLEAGKLPESMQFQFEALKISEKIKDSSVAAIAINRIGNIYMELGDYRKANEYYFRSKDLFEKLDDIGMFHNEMSNIGHVYELLQLPDSALYYLQIVYDATFKTDDRNKYTRGALMFKLGNAYNSKGDKGKAMYFYKQGIKEANFDNDSRQLTMNKLFLARLYDELDMPDSSIKYAYNAMQTSNTISFRKGVYNSALLISELYKKRSQYDSAYKYLSISNMEKDSLTGPKRFLELQRIMVIEQEKERDTEVKRIAAQNKQRQLLLISGLVLFLIIAIFLLRNNKQKQKANRVLENTLTRLRLTQSQLIQSEKMASLGELTAGIAHEIQNPLNFVNNFSEVSNELIDELNMELDKGEVDEAKAISSDIKKNLEKINHHGKRADAIVKGMLQHSRSSSGQKELTDINALCDEYLRLAYHGLRAKDKSFNASFETHFDDSIGKINIVPQDIGRVLLNLINNAFYAVNERQKKEGEGFKPLVEVSTRSLHDKIEIAVKDNGGGIPNHIKEKIFQPFFTTKPTGSGTGLGLSLSYDIVKAHGGEIKLETKKGEGTTFIIFLKPNL